MKTGAFLGSLALVLLGSLLLYAAMGQMPRLVGEEAETVRYEIDTGTLGIIPEEELPTYGIPQLTVPDFFGPEDLPWITCNELLDESAAIPSAMMSYRPAGRILTDTVLAAKLVEVINGFPYMSGTIPLSELEGMSYYSIRFGTQSPVLTVYANGYVSFSDWPFAAPVRDNDCYGRLAEAYEQAVTKFAWMPLLVTEDTDPLRTGHRIYHIGDQCLISPLPAETLESFRQDPDYARSVSAEDVVFMTELIAVAAKEQATMHFSAFGSYASQQVSAAPTDKRTFILYHWLFRLTDGVGMYSVENQTTGITVTAAYPANFWFFPQLPEGTDGAELLLRYQEGERNELLQVSCFHISKSGILYYPSLADDVPTRIEIG